MFLVILKRGPMQRAHLTQNGETATAMAKAFVGEHNPVDGCSTPVEETVGEGGRVIRTRASSFGRRYATILPIAFDDTLDL